MHTHTDHTAIRKEINGDLQSAAARRVTTRQSLLRPGRLQAARFLGRQLALSRTRTTTARTLLGGTLTHSLSALHTQLGGQERIRVLENYSHRARRRKCREEADQRARGLPRASPPALGLVRAPSSLALSLLRADFADQSRRGLLFPSAAALATARPLDGSGGGNAGVTAAPGENPHVGRRRPQRRQLVGQQTKGGKGGSDCRERRTRVYAMLACAILHDGVTPRHNI